MNKSFYMYMSMQGMGRNVFACLIAIFSARVLSVIKGSLLAGCGSCGTDRPTGKFV